MVVVRELDLPADDQVRLAREISRARLDVPCSWPAARDLRSRAGAAGVQLGWGSPSRGRSPRDPRVRIGSSAPRCTRSRRACAAGRRGRLPAPRADLPDAEAPRTRLPDRRRRRPRGWPRDDDPRRRGRRHRPRPARREVLDAGAAGIAAIRAFMAAGRGGRPGSGAMKGGEQAFLDWLGRRPPRGRATSPFRSATTPPSSAGGRGTTSSSRPTRSRRASHFLRTDPPRWSGARRSPSVSRTSRRWAPSRDSPSCPPRCRAASRRRCRARSRAASRALAERARRRPRRRRHDLAPRRHRALGRR